MNECFCGEGRRRPYRIHSALKSKKGEILCDFTLIFSKNNNFEMFNLRNVCLSQFLNNAIIILGPDHLQLTLLNWETESVLALNKKLQVNWKFQFFFLVSKPQNTFGVKSIADDPPSGP